MYRSCFPNKYYVVKRKELTKPGKSIKKLVRKLRKSGYPLTPEELKKVKEVCKGLKAR